MTNAQLRARELVMHENELWLSGTTVAVHWLAKRNRLRVREVEAAIEAAVEDERLDEAARRRYRIENWKPGPLVHGIYDARFAEIEREADNFHSHVHDDGSITIVPGRCDDCQSRWFERAKVAKRARQQGPSQ